VVSEETAKAESEGLSGLGRNGNVGMGMEISASIQTTSAPVMAPVGGFTGRRYGDFRLEEPDELPSAGLSLFDYVVTKSKRRGRQKKQNDMDPDAAEQEVNEDGNSMVASDSTTTVAKCPVCGEFEGDEVAVAHHVNTHFD
jgi:hypothetical protein